MNLTEQIKQNIQNEYDSWFESQYGNVSPEKRAELGAFYTPPNVIYQMLEKVKTLDTKILDPCCGTGNLLAACIIAGADPDNIYGNEYNEEFMLLARERLKKLCANPEYNTTGHEFINWHIHQGNALQLKCCSEFDKNYDKNYNPKYIDDLEYAQGPQEIEIFGEKTLTDWSWKKDNLEAEKRLNLQMELEKQNKLKLDNLAKQKELSEQDRFEQVSLW